MYRLWRLCLDANRRDDCGDLDVNGLAEYLQDILVNLDQGAVTEVIAAASFVQRVQRWTEIADPFFDDDDLPGRFLSLPRARSEKSQSHQHAADALLVSSSICSEPHYDLLPR